MANANGILGLGLLMLVGGIALLAWAVSSGDAEFYLFIIFPVVTGTGPVFAGGALLFMIGLIVTFMGISMRAAERMAEEYGEVPQRPAPQQGEPRPEGKVPMDGGPEFGGVVFLGPIPIVFGKGQRTSKWMLVASIVFGILLIVFLVGLFL
ncbi:MAG: DUF131 domain-containing protein [Thermoplasmata archaeon]|nr:MAG: DUF131 domain-containing protein [Thermoplasmata archaeon]